VSSGAQGRPRMILRAPTTANSSTRMPRQIDVSGRVPPNLLTHHRPLSVTSCPPLGEVPMTEVGEIVVAVNTRQTPTRFRGNTPPAAATDADPFPRKHPTPAARTRFRSVFPDPAGSAEARALPSSRECRYRSDRGTPTVPCASSTGRGLRLEQLHESSLRYRQSRVNHRFPTFLAYTNICSVA
jgi:hypothetical protein